MHRRKLVFISAVVGALLVAGPSFADDAAQSFVQREHMRVTELLKQPATPARDGQVDKVLEEMVDYDELARRSLGQPCPTTAPTCTNHWNELSEAQRVEIHDLLKRLVEKNYKKNLVKTLDYEVTYKGAKEQAGDSKIRTEAKSKLKPRDPAIQIDYLVRPVNGKLQIIDVVTEGSILTKNYYDQFHKMLTNPAQGYPHVVTKLKERIAKKD